LCKEVVEVRCGRLTSRNTITKSDADVATEVRRQRQEVESDNVVESESNLRPVILYEY